jgi:hypothetical protein
MDQSKVWGLPRYVTLLVVTVLHLALVAALWTESGSQNIPLAANEPVELLYIPPAIVPKIRAENSPARRLRGDTSIAIAPPVLDADALAAPPGSASEGSGSGVNWAAEARRAVQAFEIRRHEPARNTTVSRSPAEENWWPQVQHHAGDQYRTANGDWIVWINAGCYQVASAAANANAPGALLPQTFCPGDARASRGEPSGR